MHKAFFGDRERDFSLTSQPILEEFERRTGKAIGATIDDIRRLSYAEIVHTVRLGLIGGRAHPKEATELVQTYVTAHPLSELNLLAISILTDLWAGPEEPAFSEATNDEKADAERQMNGAARNAMQEAAATGDLSGAINGVAA